MKGTAYLLIALAIFAAGTAGGAIAAWKIGAGQIEELSGSLAKAEEERDTAVETSIRTFETAASIIAGQQRVSGLLAELEREIAARAAEERALATAIRCAPPEDNGPLPKVVVDTVMSLYGEAAP